MALTYWCSNYTHPEFLVDTIELQPSYLQLLWFSMGNLYLLRVNDDTLLSYWSEIFPCKLSSWKIRRISRTIGSSFCSKHIYKTRFSNSPCWIPYSPSTDFYWNCLPGRKTKANRFQLVTNFFSGYKSKSINHGVTQSFTETYTELSQKSFYLLEHY